MTPTEVPLWLRIERHWAWIKMVKEHRLNADWFYAGWYQEQVKRAEDHLTNLLWQLTSQNYR